MRIFESEQGTIEWKIEKLGHFSGSKASDLLMAQSTAGWKTLINQILYEKLTGEVIETYQNQDMKNGTENEPLAREAYELLTFHKVHQIGFMELNEWIGASLDGVIGDKGGVEIKCPKWNTQLDYLLSKKVPRDYYSQIQFQLYVSGREWIDFFSWHPKLPPFMQRVTRDEETIKKIEDALITAIKEVQQRLTQLKD